VRGDDGPPRQLSAERKFLEDPMTVSPMTADKFWQIIARAGASDYDPDAHMEALRTALRELPVEEVVAFEAAFRRYLNEAYTWDLWGAAYVIHGGCSDDATPMRKRGPIRIV
jgi:hypothetical protein